MKKVCSGCGKEKFLSEFHKGARCRFCVGQAKKRTEAARLAGQGKYAKNDIDPDAHYQDTKEFKVEYKRIKALVHATDPQRDFDGLTTLDIKRTSERPEWTLHILKLLCAMGDVRESSIVPIRWLPSKKREQVTPAYQNTLGPLGPSPKDQPAIESVAWMQSI